MKIQLPKLILKPDKVIKKPRQVKSQFHRSKVIFKDLPLRKGRLKRRHSEHQSPMWKSVDLSFSRRMSEFKKRIESLSKKSIWIGEKSKDNIGVIVKPKKKKSKNESLASKD